MLKSCYTYRQERVKLQNRFLINLRLIIYEYLQPLQCDKAECWLGLQRCWVVTSGGAIWCSAVQAGREKPCPGPS